MSPSTQLLIIFSWGLIGRDRYSRAELVQKADAAHLTASGVVLKGSVLQHHSTTGTKMLDGMEDEIYAHTQKNAVDVTM